MPKSQAVTMDMSVVLRLEGLLLGTELLVMIPSSKDRVSEVDGVELAMAAARANVRRSCDRALS